MGFTARLVEIFKDERGEFDCGGGPSPEERIRQISERLAAYHEHENDPYSYSPREIQQVRDFFNHAVEDMKFLLEELGRLLTSSPSS